MVRTITRLTSGLTTTALTLAATASLLGCDVQQEPGGGLSHPERWLTYSGDYSGQRHSPLTQITPANVGQLQHEWTFEPGDARPLEATPLVYDGTLYFSGLSNTVWAIDGRTGQDIWRYDRELPKGLRLCCNASNRGLAMHGDRLFLATLDAHLVALDRHTGAVLFDVAVDETDRGYSATAAPLVVHDKVIVGISGGEFASRGFLDAYDAESGRRLWRFWTVPGPGEPGSETWPPDVWEHGGGPTWLTGTYDPDLDLLYWGTGNPSPPFDGGQRAGDNLYTNSLVALDAETGALRWHFQFTPHDTHDWDANQIPVLADLRMDGRVRRVVMTANRNGFFYVLDRVTGEFLLGQPFVNTTWAKEIGPDGRPIVLPDQEPTVEGTRTCPGDLGGTNFMSPSFDPGRNLFFVTARETCGTFFAQPARNVKVGNRAMGGRVRASGSVRWGALRALDPLTGAMQWERQYASPGWAGVLSTVTGVVFSGDDGLGIFMALDAETGRQLWQYDLQQNIRAAPLTYMIGDRQYVTIASVRTLASFALPPSN